DARMNSYLHGTSAIPLLGDTIGENLRRTVDRFGDREALVVRWQGYRATYRELWDQTTALARALIASGVQAGDRVGIWAPNRFEWVVTQFASARIGAILVNLNPAYKASELQYALTQSGVSLLVHARAFRSNDYVSMVAEARPRCPELRETIVIDSAWDALLARASATPADELAARESRLQFDDPINILYTGYLVGEMIKYTEQDRVCIPVPFYHCFGMVMGNLACSSHGACMVVAAEAFDALATLDAVAAERCTALYGVPTMCIAQLAHPRFREFDLSSLRTGIMAGSPCPVEVMKQVQSTMP